MKKLMVMALTVTLLFTGIGMTASAAGTCNHSNTVSAGTEWRTTGNGYNHAYTTSSGTKGCGVTIMEKYTVKKCIDCGVVICTPTGVTWESHDVTSHNGPKP